MPNDNPRKAPKSKRYDNAVKVNQAPSQKEGWSKGETIGENTYYDKSATKAISGGTPGSEWDITIKKMLASGVSPEELVKQGHISSDAVDKYRPFYKAVYTVTEPKAKVAENNPVEGIRSGRNLLPKLSANQPWESYVFRDPNGQVNMSKTVHFDPATGKEVSPEKWNEKSGFSDAYTGKTIADWDKTSQRSDAFGKSLLPDTDPFGNPITKKGTVSTKIVDNGKMGTKGAGTSGFYDGGTIPGDPIKKVAMRPSTPAPVAGTDVSKDIFSPSYLSPRLGSTELTGGGKFKLLGPQDPLFNPTPNTPNNIAPVVQSGIGIQSNADFIKTQQQALGIIGKKDGGKIKGYEAGGFLQKTGQFLGNSLKSTADVGLSMVGANNIIQDSDYKGAGASAFKGYANVMGGIGKAILPVAATALGGPMGGAAVGAAVGAGQQVVGGFNPEAEKTPEQLKLEREAKQQEALQRRALGETNVSLANGGKIVGPGTGKSDSIKAKASGFVVPKENAHIAEELRAKVLKKAPNMKANLNQKNGTQVKLSNGEHLFTPEEVKELQTYGYDVDALAPNSDDKKSAMKDGGLTADKARIMLKDNQANGKPLTSAQKRYFGWIVGGGKAEGGMLYADGGRIKGETQQQYVARMKATPTNKVETNTEARSVKRAPKSTIQYIPKMDNENLQVPGSEKSTLDLGNPTERKYVSNLNQTQGDILSQSASKAAVDSPPVVSKPFNFGSALETGAAIGQIGLGLSNLRGEKRPIYKTDPTFEANVQKAQANAQFGYTPEQQYFLDQQNQGLTNAARFSARNLSGGSAANALAMERSALNDAAQRNLSNVIGGQQLKMDKQAVANNLMAQKMDVQRQIFNDANNAFMQKQNAGSELVGAGVRNLINSGRIQKELSAQEKANNISNSWINSI